MLKSLTLTKFDWNIPPFDAHHFIIYSSKFLLRIPPFWPRFSSKFQKIDEQSIYLLFCSQNTLSAFFIFTLCRRSVKNLALKSTFCFIQICIYLLFVSSWHRDKCISMHCVAPHKCTLFTSGRSVWIERVFIFSIYNRLFRFGVNAYYYVWLCGMFEQITCTAPSRENIQCQRAVFIKWRVCVRLYLISSCFTCTPMID